MQILDPYIKDYFGYLYNFITNSTLLGLHHTWDTNDDQNNNETQDL